MQMFICTEESKYIWWGRDENLQLDINQMLKLLKSDDYMRFLIVCSTLNCFEYLAAKRIVCRKAENNFFFCNLQP